MAGPSGPIPKRSSQRRRRNKPGTPTDTVQATGRVQAPPQDETWHPIAAAWYESLAESGQVEFFEPSDWQAARFVAEAMTKNLNAGRFSAQLFAAVWAAMGELLTTEGARRRARLEVERAIEQPDEASEVTALDDFRRRLSN